MEYLIVVAVIAVVIAICAGAISAANGKKRRLADAQSFAEFVREHRVLPRVATSVMLKPDEAAFYSSPTKLYETRAVRYHQSSGARVRIAKGISVGGSSGRSTSTQEWSQIDSGLLVVTNKRIVFDGGAENRSVTIKSIISVNPSADSIEVSSEKRNKSMVFSAENPLILAAILSICCQASDPLDLSDTKLQISFE